MIHRKHYKTITSKAKESAHEFKKEFRKTTATAIITAFGLIIALAWQDVIKELISSITLLGSVQGSLLGALIITAISVLGILIVSKILKKED